MPKTKRQNQRPGPKRPRRQSSPRAQRASPPKSESRHLNLLWKTFIRLSKEVEMMEALLKDLP